MNARVPAIAFVAFTLVAIGVGCTEPVGTAISRDDDESTNDDNDVTSTKKQAPSTTASSSSTAAPAPAPTPAATTTSAPDAGPPAPTTDPRSCQLLTSCCAQIVNTYGQLACAAAAIAGNVDTCAKSLIACQLANGFGNGGANGNGARCQDDFDCPGAERCIQRVCR